MTRGEAKATKVNVDLDYLSKRQYAQLMSVIDNIYDDFESRICENCRYSNPVSYICQELGGLQLDKDFGCNQFSCK